MIEERKEWLTSGMSDRKRRRELGLPELYLYGKETSDVTYKDFVDKELILFSNLDNERSIPSLVDGLKPGQRKVMFTCIKRNDKREVKVAQLAGSVAEHSAYHHGEVSLMSTIINLAQNYVGSNNINLLHPIGQFGTRLQGGKDSASPRYIFTMLSPLARLIFNPLDAPLLNYLYDDNQRIEPEYYVPLIPMVLVNGAEGIGTGWSTKIPNYNPRDLVKNLRRLIAGEDTQPMTPWFKNFRGTVEQVETNRFVVSGEIAVLTEEMLEITELPVRTWTQNYKENVLEAVLPATDRSTSMITNYREYNTDTTVKFILEMTEEKLAEATRQGLHKVFKLQTSISNTTMVLFDSHGCLRKYENPDVILREFFHLRMTFYERRKDYLVGMLTAESLLLTNQARFIMEKCDGTIVIENRKKVEMIETLVKRGYDSDPVKAWKRTIQQENQSSDEEDGTTEEVETSENAPDFNYLLGMPMWNLTKEKKDELLEKRDLKKTELETLEVKSPSDLWIEDLDKFEEELEIVEAKEREEERSEPKAKKPKGKKKAKVNGDTGPSKSGQRVEPTIDPELRRKLTQVAKDPKERRRRERTNNDDADEKNDPKPLSKRLGVPAELLKETSAKRQGSKTNLATIREEKKRDGISSGSSAHSTSVKKQRAKANQPSIRKRKKNNSSDSSETEVEGDMEGKLGAATFRPKRTNVAPIKYNVETESEGIETEDNENAAQRSDEEDGRKAFDEVSSSSKNSSVHAKKRKKPVPGLSSEDEEQNVKAPVLWSDSDESDEWLPRKLVAAASSKTARTKACIGSSESDDGFGQAMKTKGKAPSTSKGTSEPKAKKTAKMSKSSKEETADPQPGTSTGLKDSVDKASAKPKSTKNSKTKVGKSKAPALRQQR